MNQRELFFKHLAPTSPSPLALEISKAEGALLYDASGKEYIDLIGGISVANVGHRHPKVIAAIHKQLDAYLHVMVYGEMIQSPQVQYASSLAAHLPHHLQSVFFTNSGSEAIEGAMKLAKRFTGRTGIAAFKNSYHGSTQGALSIIGDEYWRNAYRPLLPHVSHLDYNNFDSLNSITTKTACVIVEPVQAEAGIIPPNLEWFKQLRQQCSATNTLLVLDEVQSAFGRTGSLWAFEQLGIEPDVLVLGKALGGGMPLGAFIASSEIMQSLTTNPVLGHITTFGGHPVCCAAGFAAFEALFQENHINTVQEKTSLFRSLLQHPLITNLRHYGLWLAVEFENDTTCQKLINHCIENGVLTDWFLFAGNCLRISPPLVINHQQITLACEIILQGLDKILP